MSLRPFRIAGATLVILLGLVFAAAWTVPLLLDWNHYRDTIAELVSDKLGRAVRIEGPISLSLLPQPILTASRISVADAQDGVTIGLAELRLRLALGPLLSGRVDAQELELRGLDVRLPWPISPDPIALRSPLWLSALSARIEDGSLTIGTLAITGITATLGTVADTGSIALAGQAQISGLAWHITARLTQPDGNGAAGLDVSLDGQGPMQGLGTMFSGQIAADGTLGGRVSGRGPDLSRLLPAPAVPFRADGRLSLAAGIAIADQLALDIAGSPARGTVSLRLSPAQRLDVSLAASRLDLDAWLPQLLRGTAGANPATPTLTQHLPTTIDLSAEAAGLAGGILRGLRGRFELGASSVILHDVAAMLPGDAQLRLDGTVTRPTADSVLHLDAATSLAAPNLRTSLAWLENAGLAPLADLPPGVLRTATLRATVTADTGPGARIVLSDLQGVLDDSQLRGRLALRPVPTNTPALRMGVTALLDFDQLELDPWLATLPRVAALPARLGRLDLDLRLAAAAATLQGHRLTRATLDLATEPGKLILRQVEATSLGVHLAALGTLQDGGRLTDARLELQAGTEQTAPALTAWFPDLAPLAARLPRDPLALTLTGGGPTDALALRATVDFGDLHVEAQPVLNLAQPRWTSQIMLRHPGAPRLLDSIGLPGTAAWLGDGSLSLVANLAGDLGKIGADSFDLSAGSLRATGALSLDRGTTPTTLSGRVSAETLPLPLPYPRSREPLPTGLLAGLQANVRLDAAHVLVGLTPMLDQATATLSLANGLARLDAITARVDGGTLTGSLGLDAAAAPLATAELSLAGATITQPLFDLPLDLASGQLDATVSLSASGHSPQALLATLSGTAKLTARGGDLTGVALDRIGPRLDAADLRAALSGGTTPFTDIELAMALRNGAVTLATSAIRTATASATLTGLVDIPSRTTELRLAVRPNVDDPPEIAVRLGGNLDKPTRTPELANALAWRALHP